MKRVKLHDLTPQDLAGLPYAQYIRESTKQQADGFGPDSQRHANRTFADRFDLIDSSLEFVEFESGTSTEHRHALRLALDALKAGQYRVLLVGWTHRLARSTEDASRIKREVSAAGGIIVYSAQGLISGHRGNSLTEKMSHVLDEEYSERLSDVIAAGLQAKFEAGYTNGRPVLGTKHVYIRRDGSLAEGPERNTVARRVIDDERIATIRALLAHYSAHGSYRVTADWLNAAGHRARTGQLFTDSSVRDVVVNPFYGPDEIVVYHERLPDRQDLPTPSSSQIFPHDIHDLWLGCQSRRQHRASLSSVPQHRVYPLHPALRCARCGSIYWGEVMKGRRYSKHLNRMSGCPFPHRIRSEVLEAQLIELMEQFRLPRNWKTQLQVALQQPVTNDYHSHRERLTRALDNLRKQHTWGEIDDQTFRRDSSALRRELDRVPQERPSSLDSYRIAVEAFRSVGTAIKPGVVAGRTDALELFKRWCETVFLAVEVDGRQVVAVDLRDRYREVFAIGIAPHLVGEVCARLDSNQHSR